MRKTRRISAAAFVAAILAAILAISGGSSSADPGGVGTGGLEDRGTLTLTTEGGPSGLSAFTWQDKDDVLLATHPLVEDRCVIQPSSVDVLVDIDSSRGDPGLTDGEIGNKNRGPGASCGKTEAPESLTLSLDGLLAGVGGGSVEAVMTSMSADIQVKKDARILAETYVDGEMTDSFELRSGDSIVAGEEGPDIVNCLASSDSGPDAGDRDNCQWERDVLVADTIVFTTVVGEWSLEGGGDGGDTGPSVFELAAIDAFLDCRPEDRGEFQYAEGGVGTTDTPRAQVIRLGNVDPTELCVPIGASLETAIITGNPDEEQDVELLTQTGQDTASYLIQVLWDQEASGTVPAPTTFSFGDGPEFELEMCPGTAEYGDASDWLTFTGLAQLTPPAGTDFITHVSGLGALVPDSDYEDKTGTLDDGYQFACFIRQVQTSVNGLADTMVVEQGIYLVGDWRSFR